MPRTLSLTTSQIDALTSANDTILYNAQQRGITLYGGTDLASNITQLEINNSSGECLTLRYNSDTSNYSSFNIDGSGTLNLNVHGGDKSFNIVNHNGSSSGLMLNGDLVIATAYELNQLSGLTAPLTSVNFLDATPGTASAGKALITDSNNNISGINDLSTNNLTVNGTLVTASATELNYTDISTAGTAQAAKALVVDVNRSISNINSLTATNLTGTLQTAAQTNITSVGTLGDLTVTNQVNAASVSTDAVILNGTDISSSLANLEDLAGITAGTVAASKAVIVDSNKNLTGMGNLTSTGTVSASTLTGTISTASQPNITSTGTLTGLTIASTGNVTGAANVSATTLTGTLTTASQPNVTSVGTLNGLSASGNVNIASHNGTTTGLKLNGTLVTAQATDLNKLPDITASATQLNYLSGVTPGVVSSSKALVVDGNSDLNGARNIIISGSISGGTSISATTLTGQISTAAQPNITSVGTLGDLTVTNQVNAATISTDAVILNGTDITSSLANIGDLSGITAGTVTASKVVIVDSNKNLTGMGNLTSTGTISASTLTGTLSTAAQPNVTSVGNLSSLTIANNGNLTMSGSGAISGVDSISATTLVGTLSTAAQTNVTSVGNLSSLTIANNGNIAMSGTGTLTGAATISATTLTGTLSTAAQPNITSTGTLAGLTASGNVNVSSHNGSTTGLKLAGTLVTAAASDINTLTGVTAGTVSGNKVVIVDTNKNLSGLNNVSVTGTVDGITTLTATTLVGTLSTASQPSITSTGTLTGLSANGVVNIAQHDGSTNGLKLNNVLVTALASDINKLSNMTSTTAQLNTVNVTPGTVSASKALVVDSSSDLSGIHNLTLTGTLSGVSTLTATNIAGTLSTASQPSITTLDGVTSIGATNATALKGTLSTAAQPSITTLDGVTSIGATNATALKGTLSTAAQPSITSVGTLTSLTLGGALNGVTTINSNDVFTNTLATASTSSSTGAVILSGGIATSKTTDATSSTNGGTFTSAGGGAFAKSLYVGTNLNVTGTTTIGSDLTVAGNLSVTGTTTTINSTSTIIHDNTLVLNSGPAGSGYDSGVLSQRYQISNSAGTGDVVSDTAKDSFAVVSGTTTTIVLASGASSVDGYYNNWWVKFTAAGSLLNQVRQVASYVGSTKTITLVSGSPLPTAPTSSDNINLFNKPFTSLLWNENNKRFTSAFTSNDTSSGPLTIYDYADFQANNIYGAAGTLTTLSLSGAITGATAITASGAITGSSLALSGAITGATGIACSGNISGTLTTAAQTGITSVGTLSSLTVTNAISGASLALSGAITGATGIACSGNISGTLTTAAQTGITSVGTLSSLTVTNAISGASLELSGAITGATTIVASSTITATGAITGASLALSGAITGATAITSSGVLSGSSLVLAGAITGASSIACSGNISGTLTTAAQTGITSVGTLSSLTVTNAISGGSLALSGSITSSAHIVCSGDISGTLITAAQTNITSIGTLNSLTVTNTITGTSLALSGAITGATSLALSGAITGATSLALSGAITGATSLACSGNISGTLTTAAQTGITSVGTLNSLAVNNGLTMSAGTLALSGTSSTLTIANTTASESSSTGALQVAGGAYIGGHSLFGGVVGITGNLIVMGTISGTLANLDLSSVDILGLNGTLSSTLLGNWSINSAPARSYTSGLWIAELGRFVMTYNNITSSIVTSSDGTTWTDRGAPSGYIYSALNSMCYSPELGMIIVVGSGTNGGTNYSWGISYDGITWSAGSNSGLTSLVSICWSGDLKLFVALSSNGTVMYSSTGLSNSWTNSGYTNGNLINVIWCRELGLFVGTIGIAGSTPILTSPDAINWTTRTAQSASGGYSSVAWSKDLGYLVALGRTTNDIIYSTNGTTWAAVASPPTLVGAYKSLSWIPEMGTFIAVGGSTATGGNNYFISYNATTWTVATYTSTYADVRSCIMWSPELSKLLIPSSNVSSSYPVISTSQSANSSLNIVTNTINSNTYNYGMTANSQVIFSSGLNGTFKWIDSTSSIASNELMRLTKDSYLGINTKSPQRLLHLTTTSTSNYVMRLSNYGNNHTDIGVDAAGNLLISSTSSNSQIYLGKNSSAGNCARIGFNYVSSGNSSNCFNLSFPVNTVYTLNAIPGCVGINTNTIPTNPLQIGDGTGGNTTFIIASNGSFTAGLTTTTAISTINGSLAVGGPSSTNLSTVPLSIKNWITTTINSMGGTSIGTSTWYINTNGAVTTPGDGSVSYQYSAYFAKNVAANAFLTFSDRRIKTDINPLPVSLSKKFIMECTPVLYRYKDRVEDNGLHTQFGYIAQDVYKSGFADLINIIDGEDDDEYLVETVDDDGFVSPKGIKFTVSYIEIIPILATSIRDIYNENEALTTRVSELESKNTDLETRLAKLEAFINTLEITE